MSQRFRGRKSASSRGARNGTRNWNTHFDTAKQIRSALSAGKIVPVSDIERAKRFCRSEIYNIDPNKRKKIARLTISFAELFENGNFGTSAASLDGPINSAIHSAVPIRNLLTEIRDIVYPATLKTIAEQLQSLGLIDKKFVLTPSMHTSPDQPARVFVMVKTFPRCSTERAVPHLTPPSPVRWIRRSGRRHQRPGTAPIPHRAKH